MSRGVFPPNKFFPEWTGDTRMGGIYDTTPRPQKSITVGKRRKSRKQGAEFGIENNTCRRGKKVGSHMSASPEHWYRRPTYTENLEFFPHLGSDSSVGGPSRNNAGQSNDPGPRSLQNIAHLISTSTIF